MPHSFPGCEFETDGHYSVTRFPDGTQVQAVPHDTDDYRQRARELGYGEDTAALSREHEFLHSFLAETLGDYRSLALWNVAHGEPPIPEVWEEESMVMEFQGWLNGVKPAPALFLERLRERVLEMVRATPPSPSDARCRPIDVEMR